MILVHICCSVDSHFFLQKLREIFLDSKLIGYFYNPNIHPKAEYDLRLSDVKRSCAMLDIELFEGEYETPHWFDGVKGLENEPEKGERCVKCFDIRLIQSAIFAKARGITRFTSTLLSSPMKEQEILYKQGDAIAKEHNLEFIKLNVRANGGTQEQAALAKKDNLYRQNYCGCEFALNKQREKSNKIALELIENIGRQFLPASNEDRIRTFARRDELEQTHTPYILSKRAILAWRVLRANARCGDELIDIYVLCNSQSKNAIKTSGIVWIKTLVPSPHFLAPFLVQNDIGIEKMQQSLPQTTPTMQGVFVGLASKDDSMFLSVKDINALCKTSYASVREMLQNPLPYEVESALRICLCGFGSINPIVVLDTRRTISLRLSIRSVFQEESVFRITQETKTQ